MAGEPRVADMNISDEHFIVEAKTSMKQVAEILLQDHKAAILVRDRKEGRIVSALNAADLKSVLSKLGLGPREILRSKEAKEEGIEQLLDCNDIIAAIASHPRAMQRPIVVKGNKAAIGRPPENVLKIL